MIVMRFATMESVNHLTCVRVLMIIAMNAHIPSRMSVMNATMVFILIRIIIVFQTIHASASRIALAVNIARHICAIHVRMN